MCFLLLHFQICALNSNWCCFARSVGAARIFPFLPPYAAARIRIHIRRIAPNLRDLLKDALPTELPRHGNNLEIGYCFRVTNHLVLFSVLQNYSLVEKTLRLQSCEVKHANSWSKVTSTKCLGAKAKESWTQLLKLKPWRRKNTKNTRAYFVFSLLDCLRSNFSKSWQKGAAVHYCIGRQC